jgi:hypothetical protein
MSHYQDQYERDAVGLCPPQVGGSHYQSPIQPIDYIAANELGFKEGNIVKYVTRWKRKGGVEDLKKARHYLDLLIKQGY